MERQSDLLMAPAERKFSLALAAPTSASTQGLTMLVSLCKTPRGQVGTNSDPDPSALQELVEWVLEEVAQRPRVIGTQGGPLILEVGCGSGAISLSLLSHLPQVSCLGILPPHPGLVLTVPAPPVSAGGAVVTAFDSHPLLSEQREGKAVDISLLFWQGVGGQLWSLGLASLSTLSFMYPFVLGTEPSHCCG